jgi:hypothetical protein
MEIAVNTRHKAKTDGKYVPSLSLWNDLRKFNSLSLFLRKMVSICGGFLGFATKTYTLMSILTCRSNVHIKGAHIST